MRTIVTIAFLVFIMAFSRENVNTENDIEMLPLDTLEEVIITPQDYEFIILEELWKNGVSVDLSYIILAQAKHETWDFTSKIFIENNNVFGLKQAKKRKTTCTGTNRGHGTYASIEDCVLDYIYYMENRKIPFHEISARKYVNLLKKKGYFEDNLERYYNSVKKHKNNLNKKL